LDNVSFEESYIDEIRFVCAGSDAVISNGVNNVSPGEDQVVAKAHRVLTAGGRLAVSDIISEELMPQSIKSDADLWASCIGGAEQIDAYRRIIESAGFEIVELRDNPAYEFASDRATDACRKYGVKSVSLLARA
jgi:ubiquinone/menaquinone biosynthesis C-methylase UbiE